ncbi:U11/U12 small nuclear ribonucleoprotein 48 kDa protein [Nilaparvata lugens]|uniref:U11/U12 small nuclear ribonucleoprotein 48 kDa protein n=1 Tax=Nilaparvata lugens TaxID=108931 RepID=UPI00193D2358|nr:U11/U12 small nuclear ribonucleoprotein 48 kDa protein [Nilaparvata lugens]
MKNRVDYINELNSFVSSSKSCMLKICEDLCWNNGHEAMPQTDLQDEIVVCPLDSGHRMPKKSLPSHIEKCQLHKQGYSESSVMFPPLRETGPHTVKIDEVTLNSILQPSGDIAYCVNSSTRRAVPLSADRMMTDFTSTERLAIYDYVVKNTNNCSKEDVKEINLTSHDEKDTKPMTLEELAAADRDAKRRRIRYKSKKVHTNRKSQTEVLRGVIQSQMDGYVKWMKQQRGDRVEEDSELISSEEQKPDCSSNTVQEATSSIRAISHGWERWDYFGLNPHKRYIHVLKEEADKKIKENRKFHDKHESRAKDSYSSRYQENDEREREDFTDKDNKHYKYDYSQSRYKSSKYHGRRKSIEVKLNKHKEREYYRVDSPRIKIEPHSSSYDKHEVHVDYRSDRKDSKNPSFPNCHTTSKSNVTSYSECYRESRKTRDRKHKSSHKYKKKKYSSKKKKRKRHSSTGSSETGDSKLTDENNSISE